jgi:hypothetical protein
VTPQSIAPPESQRLRIAAGVLLIAVPSAFMVFFTLLQMRFDYPDILRNPAADVLTRFAAQQDALLPLWYGMFASALGFVPLSICVALLCRRSLGQSVSLVAMGSLAGLVQSVGLARWVFAMPILAAKFVTATSEQEKLSLSATYETLNSLLGVGIGEHMGYLFTASWTVILAIVVARARPYTAGVGMVCAAGIAAGLLEPAGFSWAATLNAIGYSAWSLWLIWLGILTLTARPLFKIATRA